MQNVTNEAQRNYLIQELITWKDYVLQIAAYNNKGVGAFSDGIKIKTKEGGELDHTYTWCSLFFVWKDE